MHFCSVVNQIKKLYGFLQTTLIPTSTDVMQSETLAHFLLLKGPATQSHWVMISARRYEPFVRNT